LRGFNDNDRENQRSLIIHALQAKEAAEVEKTHLDTIGKDLDAQRTQALETQAKLDQLNAHLSQLKAQNGQADANINTCSADIKLCQDTESVLLSVKAHMDTILAKVMYLDGVHERSDRAETKGDIMDMVLTCLLYGLIDNSLVDEAKNVLEVLEKGDATKMLQGDDYAKQLAEIKGQIANFNTVDLLGKL
jgi:chromosome segregation ATPase